MENEELIQLEKMMRETVEENLYMKYLGIELLEIREGYALARMKYKKELTNPYGMLHGGSLYSLADTVAGTAACMCGHYVTTVSGTMSFLLSAENTEYVYCEATVLRQGRHLSAFDVRIKNDDGQLLDSGEFTFYIMDKKVLE